MGLTGGWLKMDDYKSTQTLYRRLRVKYIRRTIAALIDLLELPKKNLEKIPLSFFKKLKNSVEAELILEKDSDREMAGIPISPNDGDATAESLPKNQIHENIKKRFDEIFKED
jgi:hypothetical protein